MHNEHLIERQELERNNFRKITNHVKEKIVRLTTKRKMNSAKN